MKKYSALIWGAIVIAVFLMWWPFGWPELPTFNFGSDDSDTEIVEHNQKQVDSLKAVIQLYIEDNQELALKIQDLNQEISDLQYTIRRRENTIANLKKETNEKVTTVSKFNSTDIYKFLSDRYKNADSSATK